MLLIYSEKNSPRLQYTLQLIFSELLQLPFSFTTDAVKFKAHNDARLHYGSVKLNDELFIHADGLLFENGIVEKEISIGVYQNIKTLFAHGQSSALPFDPFAAVFYLVSRYEEYFPFQPDAYGRFPAEESISVKNNFHEVPVVNHYALFVYELLKQKFPQLPALQNKFSVQLTYDIDMAFSYRGKGFFRNTGGLLLDVLQGNFKQARERLHVLSGKQPDPFDSFEQQFQWNARLKNKPVYFFLLANHARFDKNILWQHQPLQQLIQRISSSNEIGIHSGYASNENPSLIKTEKERLEKISGQKIFRNRQHFLKLRFPETYRHLIANGITEDYTMGYSSHVGFRAGIASPFLFYDLKEEKTTVLRIMSFACMDASLHYYLQLSPQQTFEKTMQLYEAVKRVNGQFVFLAHNDLVSQAGPWPEWHLHFERLMAAFSEP